jgi:hypothetical protein
VWQPKKSAEELRKGIPALRKYIDVTKPLAPIGNGVQICSVFICGFILLFAAPPNDAG